MSVLFDTPCYYVTKLFCSICGLWPYQSYIKKIIRTFHILICLSYFPPQIRRLTQVWGRDMDAVCMCIPPMFMIILSFFKTFTIILFESEMKMLLRQIETEWRLASRGNENTILLSYTSTTRIFCTGYASMLCYAVSCYVIAPTIPLILDVVLPKNETRIRSLSFDLDYGIDMQEYWFWLWLHSSMAAIIVVFNIIAGDVMFITLNMHTCYLFAMARCELERVTDTITKCSVRNEELRLEQTAAIKRCALSHKRAIECAQLLQNIYAWSLLSGAGANVTSISIVAVQLVSKMPRWGEMMMPCAFLSGMVIHLFFLSLMAQFVLDESLSIHESAYSSSWYDMSSTAQKDIVLILIRSRSPCELTAGKLFVMSLERFCSILQTSMSYFTMLASFR